MAAREIAVAYLSIVPSAKGFGPALQKQVAPQIDSVATGAGTRAGTKAGTGLSTGLRPALTGIGTALATVGATRFLGGAIEEAREAGRVTRLTEAVIKSTGGAAGITADQVGDYANKLSLATGVDDELIQSGANVLLTFKGIRNEAGKGNQVFDEATSLALDMSTALGTDLKGSVLQVGKALNDPIKGVSALQRVGVTFTKSQKDQIKALVETGDTMGAQKIILHELKSEFGGAAEAAVDPAEKAQVAWGNFKEQFGTAVLPIVGEAATVFAEDLGPAVSGVTQLFADLPGPVKTGIIAIAGIGIAAGPIKRVSDGLSIAKTAATGLPGLMSGVGGAFQSLGGIVAANPALFALAGLVAAGAFVLAHEDDIKRWGGENLAPSVSPALSQIKENSDLLKEGFEKGRDRYLAVINNPASTDAARSAAERDLKKLTTSYLNARREAIKALEDETKRQQAFADNPFGTTFASLGDQAVEGIKRGIDNAGKALGDGWDELTTLQPDWGQIVGDVDLNDTFTGVTDQVSGFGDTIGGIFGTIGGTVSGVFTGITTGVTTAFDTALGVVTTVGTTIGTTVGFIFGGISTTLSTVWGVITGGVRVAWGIVTTVIGGAVGIIGGIVRGLGGVFSSVFDGIKNTVLFVGGLVADAIKGVINTVIRAVNWIIDKLQDFELPEVDLPGPFDFGGGRPFEGLKKIPKLAKGGIVQHATLAILGEVRPEVVAPLPDLLGLVEDAVRNVLVTPTLATTTLPELHAQIHAKWVIDVAPTIPPIESFIRPVVTPAFSAFAPPDPVPGSRETLDVLRDIRDLLRKDRRGDQPTQASVVQGIESVSRDLHARVVTSQRSRGVLTR